MSRPDAVTEVLVSGVRGGFPPEIIRGAVHHVLAAEGKVAYVAVTFLGPAAMRALNRDSFSHDYPTDVISFALPHPDGPLVGDIYICRAMAARNAREHGCTLRDELIRLAIHGTLHVLDWDHPEGEERSASPMWQQQERYLRDLT